MMLHVCLYVGVSAAAPAYTELIYLVYIPHVLLVLVKQSNIEEIIPSESCQWIEVQLNKKMMIHVICKMVVFQGDFYNSIEVHCSLVY